MNTAMWTRAGLIAVVLVGVSACHPQAQMQWTPEMVNDLDISREEDGQSKAYRFGKDGFVSASIVTEDGLAVAPVFEWRIVNGRLKTREDQQEVDWILLARSPTHIKVRREPGGVAEFDVLTEEKGNPPISP